MSNKINQLKEDYEIFLSKIDDYVEYLEEKAEKDNLSLDMNDKGALVILEDFLKFNKVTVDDFEYEAASAYLGEFIRIHFNGEWDLCLDKKNNSLYYGTPVINGLSPVSGVLYSPFLVLQSFLVDYPPNWLMETIMYEIHPEPLNLDDLPTEE